MLPFLGKEHLLDLPQEYGGWDWWKQGWQSFGAVGGERTIAKTVLDGSINCPHHYVFLDVTVSGKKGLSTCALTNPN